MIKKIKVWDEEIKRERSLVSVSKDIFQVESKTKPNQFWICNLKYPSCECPGFTNWGRKNNKLCNHLDFLLKNVDKFSEVK